MPRERPGETETPTSDYGRQQRKLKKEEQEGRILRLRRSPPKATRQWIA